MNRLASVIKSLEDIGLTESATSLRSIQKLYKTAATDFSKELEILQQLSFIIKSLHGKPLKFIAQDKLAFPPYSIETHNKYIVYSGDDLSNYSKQEILGIGFSNFLSNFVDKYMVNRLDTLSGADARKYEKAIQELRQLSSEVKSNYKKMLRPVTPKELTTLKSKNITKQDLASDLRRIAAAFANLEHFSVVVERKYVPALAHQRGYMISEEGDFIPDPGFSEPEPEPEIKKPSQEEQLKEKSQQALKSKPEEKEEEDDLEDFVDDLMKKKIPPKTASFQEDMQKLTNLTYDFNIMRDRIDNKYAQLLNMSIEDFRKLTGIDALLRKRKQAAVGDEDLLQQFQRETEQYETSYEYLQTQAAKKVADAITKGHIGELRKQKGRRKKTLVIFSPNQVLDAWDYLQNELSIKYEAFVRSVVSMTTHKIDFDEVKKTKLDPDIQKSYSDATDNMALKELTNVMSVLR